MKITNNNTAEKNESVARKPLVEMAETDHVQSKPLTPAETEHLAKCEETIGKGIKTFKEVADALQDIRDQQLYRKKHKTFEEYCRNKWKFTARHANRLISAGGVVENLRSDQLVSSERIAIPDSESSARPLAKLTPPQQMEAARIVAKKPGKHTAKQFAEAADEVVGKKSKVDKASIPDGADDEDEPRVQSYDTRHEETAGDEKPSKTSSKTSNAKATDDSDLEKLLELVDQAQTQARKVNGGADWVTLLGDLAKEITKRMNGGAK
jgi:hypothetical protein